MPGSLSLCIHHGVLIAGWGLLPLVDGEERGGGVACGRHKVPAVPGAAPAAGAQEAAAKLPRHAALAEVEVAGEAGEPVGAGGPEAADHGAGGAAAGEWWAMVGRPQP